jgi:hypothetical protein
MRRLLKVLFILMAGVPFVEAQTADGADRLAGRWEGRIASFQGERPTVAIFKRSGEGYTGRTLGLRPGAEIQLNDLKLEGDRLTARAEVETPQAALTINYTFKLEGETLRGRGELDFSGQVISFNIELKRVSGDTASPLIAGPSGVAATRPVVEQPQQRQSPDYFTGLWSFRYVGRESLLGPAPREGTVTYTKRADGLTLDARVEGRSNGRSYTESQVITFLNGGRGYTFTEQLANRAEITGRADWKIPISIHYTIDPVRIGRHLVQVRRTISIIAAHSFSLVEEISEDGGPFVRLGSALYTRTESR